MTCPTCNDTRKVWNRLLQEHRGCPDCNDAGLFIHIQPKVDACDHDFKGWREFADGNGGEQVCTKCGMGAMAHTLSLDF